MLDVDRWTGALLIFYVTFFKPSEIDLIHWLKFGNIISLWTHIKADINFSFNYELFLRVHPIK